MQYSQELQYPISHINANTWLTIHFIDDLDIRFSIYLFIYLYLPVDTIDACAFVVPAQQKEIL